MCHWAPRGKQTSERDSEALTAAPGLLSAFQSHEPFYAKRAERHSLTPPLNGPRRWTSSHSGPVQLSIGIRPPLRLGRGSGRLAQLSCCQCKSRSATSLSRAISSHAARSARFVVLLWVYYSARYLYGSRHGSKQMVCGQLISSPVFVAGTRRRENAAQTILLKAMKA
jgi:hypothetical protein